MLHRILLVVMRMPQFIGQNGFTKKQIRSDFVAGLIVTAIAIPESLGFAAIVGLPLETGLYCALLAPLVFALLTSSRHLIVGADSATAALVASGSAAVATSLQIPFSEVVTVLTIVVGLILLALSLLRFGFLADLISRPVLIGFLAGIGMHLMITKVPEMLGIALQGSTLTVGMQLIGKLDEFQWEALALSVISIFVIIVANRRKLPGALLALLVGIVLMLMSHHLREIIHTVPDLHGGLPMVTIPSVSLELIAQLIPFALGIAVVIIAQSSSVIRNSANSFNEKVDDNRDITALGAGNIASALTGGFVINGSPPRTIAAEVSGGRTQMVTIYMTGFILIVLVFFSKGLSYIPIATLAAVVFTIGMHLFNIDEMRSIWRARRSEGVVAVIAFLGVVLLGVQYGVAIAIVASIVERLRRQYRPPDEILLQDGVLAEWARERLTKNHRHRSAPSGVLAYHFGGSVFFENASFFINRIENAIAASVEPVSYVILDADSMNDIDYTGATHIKRLVARLNARDIQLAMAHVSPALYNLLKTEGLVDIIGEGNIYGSLEEAMHTIPSSKRTTSEMVHRLALPSDEYVVIGGGVMELLSIRQTNDVDMVVSDRIYKKYHRMGWREYIQDDGKKILSHNGYQMMERYVGMNLKKLQAKAFQVHGVTCMSIEDLITCKQKIGRPKDMDDIKVLDRYLKDNSTHTPKS